MKPATEAPVTSRHVLRLIGLFKLVKATLLVAVGLTALSLRHRDLNGALDGWIRQLHLDPSGKIVRAILLRAADVRPGRLVAVGVGMLFFAALFSAEGIGLLLRKRWAEYFTLIVTVSFVPLEIYEITRHPTVTRVGILAVNLAIAWYLLRRLRSRLEAA
jgi:uncharacterized membrane protein (DUF2068 family)